MEEHSALLSFKRGNITIAKHLLQENLQSGSAHTIAHNENFSLNMRFSALQDELNTALRQTDSTVEQKDTHTDSECVFTINTHVGPTCVPVATLRFQNTFCITIQHIPNITIHGLGIVAKHYARRFEVNIKSLRHNMSFVFPMLFEAAPQTNAIVSKSTGKLNKSLWAKLHIVRKRLRRKSNFTVDTTINHSVSAQNLYKEAFHSFNAFNENLATNLQIMASLSAVNTWLELSALVLAAMHKGACTDQVLLLPYMHVVERCKVENMQTNAAQLTQAFPPLLFKAYDTPVLAWKTSLYATKNQQLVNTKQNHMQKFVVWSANNNPSTSAVVVLHINADKDEFKKHRPIAECLIENAFEFKEQSP